jgi:acetyl-CoA synthase
MSREVFAAVTRGANHFIREARQALDAAIEAHGENREVSFPGTAFYLPMATALMGIEARKLKDLRTIVEHCETMIVPEIPEALWLPYLGRGLDSGAATLLAQEVIVAIRYLDGDAAEPEHTGFISDTILRELGIQLVDGRMPGFAAVLGPAPTNEIAVKTVRALQQRSILTFLLCNRDGRTMYQQLVEEGVEMGWNTYIVPVGSDTASSIYVLNWAIRGALTFGGHKRGDFRACLKYTRERIFAFGLTFGPIPDDWYAVGSGAIVMGFPVISDHESTPEVRPTGVTTYEEIVRETDHPKLVQTAIQVRGVKVKVEEIDVPVAYAAAFEGERVRKEDMHIQFGGKYSDGVELLTTRDIEEIEDGKVEVVGPDVDTVGEGGVLPLGIHVEVAGRKMKQDFEGILERQFHRYLNHAMGVMHIAQRDQIWVRISKDAVKAGFRLHHFGRILHAKFLDEFSGIVDRVQATIYTEPDRVTKLLVKARPIFDARDARVAGMTDESVDTFYSCTICQSYAPNHVCVITPERLGLCGAYNWLDGQAAHEINPIGANQPIRKGAVIDERRGEWQGVNEFVFAHSNRSVERFSAYSLMENPMTSCGCFEVIVAIIPECNGVLAVNREYVGDTPIGMQFSTLAGAVGGGAQTPGFVGVGRLYLSSKKFIRAEDGLARLVWMPKELKDAVAPQIEKRAQEMGLEGLVDKIADETIATDSETLMVHLEKVGHPVLALTPMM